MHMDMRIAMHIAMYMDVYIDVCMDKYGYAQWHVQQHSYSCVHAWICKQTCVWTSGM